MAFELAPAESQASALMLTPQPTVETASDGRMGRFMEIRVNGVALGDDRVEVIDFITPAGRG